MIKQVPSQDIPDELRRAIRSSSTGQNFSSREMAQIVSLLMECDLEDSTNRMLASSLLCSIKTRGETAEEIAGAAQALKQYQIEVGVKEEQKQLLDTCGTGGDGAHLINISTITGIVAAHLGARVAKHGNRSVSSACGSADLLEAMDYPLLSQASQVSRCVEQTGFGFLFAPHFHPALKNLAGLRRELGVRTIFNILGPLVNPACATHQLIGVFDRNLVPTVARAARDLGVKKCLVVHGEGGLDELSPCAKSWVCLAQADSVEEFQWQPADFGAEPVSLDKLKGAGPKENAHKCRQIFSGNDPDAARAIAMNCAASLWLLELYPDLKEAYQASYEALISGEVIDFFEHCREVAIHSLD